MSNAMTVKVVKNKEISSVGISVGIVGCGWLGAALASQLKKQGADILATRSNSDNVEQLQKQGINTEVLSLPAEQALLNTHSIFKQQCLVIAITPQFKQGRVDYADKIQQLVESATVGNCVKKIILLSSSAIYNGLSGQVEEDSTLDMSADKVSVLNQAEQAVLSFNATNDADALDNKKAYILRLSGLVGPNRHPGKFLLAGRILKNPQAVVNLIHQQDAVGLIEALLQSDIHGGIFNGVSSTKVTKKEYYQAAANALQLPTLHFEEHELTLKSDPKRVSGNKTRSELSYLFVYDDLLKWLEQGG
jgi:nucleoside-diphosphate-sugar epimerase